MLMTNEAQGGSAPSPAQPDVRHGPARRNLSAHSHVLVGGAILALAIAAWEFSFLLRFEFVVPDDWRSAALRALPFVLAVQALSFSVNGVFRILWPYVGIGDALVILRSAALSTAILLALNPLFPGPRLAPNSVIVLNGIATAAAISGFFLLLRLWRESRMRSRGPSARTRRVFIIGAGDSGDALLREIERLPDQSLEAAGFIDDDPEKGGTRLRGIRVLGGTPKLQRLARQHKVNDVLVALPGTPEERIREIVAPLVAAGMRVKTLPPRDRMNAASSLLPRLKEVPIENLLRREPIRLDEAGIANFLGGKNVLVTGAAGSIGSELCRQILRYGPSKVVAVDWAETPLHALMLELGAGAPGAKLIPVLGDVTDFVRIRAIFAEHSPDIVFHAAALKHVPVCEDHPREAIRVNVGGTQTVARVALCGDTSVFVLISTDKAVRPSSVMGSTKRAAELLTQALQREGGPTRFAAVRFGNVLGSNGSVLEIFKKQIARGGPLTVTHPEMRRYFMTVSEAVQLVLQAAIQGGTGEIFELDMGEPVRIVDLANDFIRLSGLKAGRDIDIEFTGMRPGEKLSEELYLNSETIEPTEHPKVFRLKRSESESDDPSVRLCLDRLGPVDPSVDPDLARLNRAFRRLLDDAPDEWAVTATATSFRRSPTRSAEAKAKAK